MKGRSEVQTLVPAFLFIFLEPRRYYPFSFNNLENTEALTQRQAGGDLKQKGKSKNKQQTGCFLFLPFSFCLIMPFSLSSQACSQLSHPTRCGRLTA
jgi:hypothetical protein